MSEEEVEIAAPEQSIKDTMREVYTGATENAVESPEGGTQVETPAAQNDQEDKQVETETEGAPEAQSAIQPPVSWPDADKAKFGKLPLDMQQTIAKRESERDRFVNQKSDELSRVKQEYGGIDSALNDINHIMRQNNLTKEQTVKEFVALYKDYTQDPVGYLTRAAQSAGIDLQKLALGQIDPMQINQRSQLAKIAELENRLNSLSTKEEQQENSYAQSEIDKFSSNPENKYFEDVKDDMALLLGAEKAKDLNDAYEKACRMNPDIFEEVQKEKAKQKAKQLNDTAQAAKKGAGVKIKTREMSSETAPSTGSIKDTIREAYKELSEGAAA